MPAALATLASRYPSLEISLTDTHPLDALELLRTGKVEFAIIFRYDEPEPAGVRLHHLPGSKRHVYAATYGERPDPPATAALLAALAEAATCSRAQSGRPRRGRGSSAPTASTSPSSPSAIDCCSRGGFAPPYGAQRKPVAAGRGASGLAGRPPGGSSSL